MMPITVALTECSAILRSRLVRNALIRGEVVGLQVRNERREPLRNGITHFEPAAQPYGAAGLLGGAAHDRTADPTASAQIDRAQYGHPDCS
jgi:hypothetical protein